MTTTNRWLPGVPAEEIEAIFRAAPGNEIGRGKFESPESSAALAGNAFGFFLHRAGMLPPLPGCEQARWPAESLAIEKTIRFPWNGGRHPVLDALLVTPNALIGFESKRFEPFRENRIAHFSPAYRRPVWGGRMGGHEPEPDSLLRVRGAGILAGRAGPGRRSDEGPASGGLAAFGREVEGDEVEFISISWRALLADWRESRKPDIRTHAENVIRCYAP